MTSANTATVRIASEDRLDVRTFSVKQALSELFLVDVRARSQNGDIDFDAIIGKPASFTLQTEWTTRTWNGICLQADQVRVERGGACTYQLMIVPRAYLLTQRRNYRVFQMKTELEIVQQLLGEWSVKVEARVDPGAYKARKYVVQYDETDFAFVSRLLEEAGVTYSFDEKDGETVLALDDAPHSRDLTKPFLRFCDEPSVAAGEWVTRLSLAQEVRPGRVTIFDLDYRKSSDNQPKFSAAGGLPAEQKLERAHYQPGAFLFKQESGGGSTPSADDRGSARTDEGLAASRTNQRLLAHRAGGKVVRFETNAIDVAPGSIVSVTNHPHRLLASGSLLALSTVIEGDYDDQWRAQVTLAPAASPHVPERKTPRPAVPGLESATVVGPDGQDIHTDEYGRVRVQFHWDREGARNEESSCWIPSSQPWSGSGFGGVNVPRVGQEVLIEFLGADPDRPVVVGRVFTESSPPPYPLPQFKSVAGLRSETTPRLVMGGSGTGVAGLDDSILGGGKPLSPEQLTNLVSNDGPFKAASPNVGHKWDGKGTSPSTLSHQWRGSELMFDDRAGKEIVYLQAQRDFNLVVKNAWTSVTGNHRSTRLGSDEKLTIGNKQEVNVVADRTINVGGKMEKAVTKEITEGTASFYSYTAKSDVTIKSDEKILLGVQSSAIGIMPDRIVVQSARVDLNPASSG